MEEWSEREVNIAADLCEVDFAKSESSKPERGWRVEDGECQGKDINRVILFIAAHHDTSLCFVSISRELR